MCLRSEASRWIGDAIRRSARVEANGVSLKAGKKKNVKLKLRRGSISRVLRKGHRVKGTVRARASDAFDNVERAKASKRLR